MIHQMASRSYGLGISLQVGNNNLSTRKFLISFFDNKSSRGRTMRVGIEEMWTISFTWLLGDYFLSFYDVYTTLTTFPFCPLSLLSHSCLSTLLSIVGVFKATLYCHELGICHRDLKPENILLTFDKELGKCIDLKLCDFG